MTENVLKKQPATRPASKGKKGVLGFFASMLDGTILTRDKVEGMLPFFMFMAVMAIVLIFNTYYAEKKARELEMLRYEIVELRLKYITTKSELMVLSNQTEVARRLKSRGIVESTVPPVQLTEQRIQKHWLRNLFD